MTKWIFTLVLSFLFPSMVVAAMQPVALTCESLTNPLGIEAAKPRLSWKLESASRGARQTAYQIVVANDETSLSTGNALVWDSGRVASDDSLHIEYAGPALVSNTRYVWKVRVWDASGAMTESASSTWRTGLLEAGDWHGKWIGRAADVAHQPAPLLRHRFTLKKPVADAQMFIAGLGYYDARINGQSVSDRVLEPGYTAYDKRVLYASHDVTKLVREGDNAIGVTLGTGWYNAHMLGVWDFNKAPWRAAPKLLAELRVHYADGSTETIATDPATWKSSLGPIVFDSIYSGEDYDARLEQTGWDTPAFDDQTWAAAEAVEAPKGKLVSQVMPPVRHTETLKAKSIAEPKPGVYVIDFGQNMSGVTQFTLDLPAGTTVAVRHGERVFADGSLDIVESSRFQRSDPVRFQTSNYTSAGTGRVTWSPKFTYYGFQYAEVTGLPAKPNLDDIVALVTHTDVESAGDFESSSDLLNRIQRATRWSFRSNLVSIPTDCPQREKNGWTGDAHLAAEQALFNFKPASVYEKWINDVADSQRDATHANGGGDPAAIVPTSGWGYDVGPAWDSALLLIPHYVHEYTGDERILTTHYDSFQRYVDYLGRRAKDDIVDYGLGDWLPWKTETPPALTGTAYYYKDVQITAQTARLLGKEEDAKRYDELADRIKTSFNTKFFDAEKKTYANGSQTALSCALYQGLVPDEHKAAVFANLVQVIEANDKHIDTGILGAKYVLLVLMDNGRTDLAYEIVTQKTQPGWGWWMEQGATTLWEDWKMEFSLNHVMFGDVSAWFYKALAGIRPDPASPGFGHVLIQPYLPDGLTHAAATYDSVRGEIRSGWKIENDVLTMDVKIPANSTATIHLPVFGKGEIAEHGKPVAEAQGVTAVKADGGTTVVSVESGTYQFTVK